MNTQDQARVDELKAKQNRTPEEEAELKRLHNSQPKDPNKGREEGEVSNFDR